MKYLLPPLGKGVEAIEAERDERKRQWEMEKESKKKEKERETTATRRREELRSIQQCREDREQEGKGR